MPLPDVLPEIPDRLLEAPGSVEEPRCDRGCVALNELPPVRALDAVRTEDVRSRTLHERLRP